MIPQRRPAAEGATAALQVFEPGDLGEELILSGPLHTAVSDLARELRHVERFVAAGIDPPTRVLFSGPSGTGKTLAARWIGARLGCPVAIADVSGVVSKYVGESAQNLTACFAAARAKPKAILFLDEVDAICARRDMQSGTSAGAELARVTTTFFQQIDWMPKDRIVVAATNFRDELDPALRRRFTTQIEFSLPDRDARRRMLEQWLAKAPLPSEQLDGIAEQTDGLSGAELRSHAMAAARRAIMALPYEEPRRLPKGKVHPEVTRASVASGQAILHLLDNLDPKESR